MRSPSAQLESSPGPTPQLENSPCAAMRTQHSQQINKYILQNYTFLRHSPPRTALPVVKVPCRAQSDQGKLHQNLRVETGRGVTCRQRCTRAVYGMSAWRSCCRKKGKLMPRVEERRVARSEEVTERAEERRKQQARLRFSQEKPHGDRRRQCPGFGYLQQTVCFMSIFPL